MSHQDARYEIKMTCPAAYRLQVDRWVGLHPEGFRVAYPARRVNTIYFDSLDMEGVQKNLDGVSERAKLRWRWYGDAWIGDSHLELKCKRATLGWKESCAIAQPFEWRYQPWSATLACLRRQADNRFRVWLDQVSCAAIINLYQRQYYVSWDGQIRLTIDSQPAAYDQRFGTSPNVRYPAPLANTLVIEVKAAAHLDRRLSAVLASWPLSPGRHSKYVSAYLATSEFLRG